MLSFVKESQSPVAKRRTARGKRFCGRLVISLARYVFASRYKAHACLVSRNWHAAAIAGPAAAARFSPYIISPYIIGTVTLCVSDDVDET